MQNQAYDRNGLDIRVSHESLEVQGEHEREPTIHLSRIDWQKEQRGESTPAGEKKRDIQERNDKCIRKSQRMWSRSLDIELS